MGEKIKKRRLQMGLTQAALSELTGLTLRTIQRIENSEVEPSLHSLKNIGGALQIELLDQEGRVWEINNRKELMIIKITDMNQLIFDLKTLIKKQWRMLLAIALILWLSANYTDIKHGIIDAWSGN